MKYIDVSKLPIYKKANAIIKLNMYLHKEYGLSVVRKYFSVFETKKGDIIVPGYEIGTFTNNLNKYYTEFDYFDKLEFERVLCFFNNLKELIFAWDNVFSEMVLLYAACEFERNCEDKDINQLFRDKVNSLGGGW